MTSSRTADRRALPASSRSGASTNSTVRGTLYAGDVLRQKTDDVGFVKAVGLHQSVGHLTQILVGDANDQAGQHIRMGGQRAFDLGGVDVPSADGEHINAPVVEIQVAVLVEVAEVAERVETVAGSWPSRRCNGRWVRYRAPGA